MIHVANYFPLLGTFFFRFWNAVFSVLSAQHHSFFVSLCCLFGWACESCSCQCHLQKLYFQSMHLPHLKKVANHFLKEEGKEERQNFITGNLTESSVRKAYKKKRH